MTYDSIPRSEKNISVEITDKEHQLVKTLIGDQDQQATYRHDYTLSEEIVSNMVCDEKFLQRTINSIKPEYFEDNGHQLLARILQGHWREFEELPSAGHIEEEIRRRTKPDSVLKHIGQLSAAIDSYKHGKGAEYLIDLAEDFAKEQTTRLSVSKIIDTLGKKRGDWWADVDEVWQTNRRQATSAHATGLLGWDQLVEKAQSEKPLWIVSELIAVGELSMPTSLAWGGKSTILGKMVADVCHANDFFWYVTTPTPILYVNADRKGYELFHSRIAPHVTNPEAMRKHFFTPSLEDMPALITPNHLLAWITEIKTLTRQPHIWVIVDTLRQAFMTDTEAGGENDSATMVKMLAPLRKLAIDTHSAITPVHHNSRGTDEYAGSGAIAALVDTWICISREKGSRVATANVETRRGHQRTWQIVQNGDGALLADQGGLTADDLNIVLCFDKERSEGDIVAITGKDRTTVRRVIKEAESVGRLVQTQTHKGATPAKWKVL